ncbi:unnamed protein product [Rotaria sp. Silwood1]|nr:unnamed protein product [Rotaria sp. Silwood1]
MHKDYMNMTPIWTAKIESEAGRLNPKREEKDEALLGPLKGSKNVNIEASSDAKRMAAHADPATSRDLSQKIGAGTENKPFVVYRDPHSVGTQSHKRLRFVCVSDTHNQIDKLTIPPGDVFIHCGDVVKYRTSARDLIKFNEFISTLLHAHKLFISGNHCVSLNLRRPDRTQKILSNMTYLQDQLIDIEGIRIYGSP